MGGGPNYIMTRRVSKAIRGHWEGGLLVLGGGKCNKCPFLG